MLLNVHKLIMHTKQLEWNAKSTPRLAYVVTVLNCDLVYLLH